MNDFDNIPAPMYGPPPVFYEEKKIVDADNIIFDFGGVLMKHDLIGCRNAFREFMDDNTIYTVLGLGNENPRGTLLDMLDRGANYDYMLSEILRHCKPKTTKFQVIGALNRLHDRIPEDYWEQIRSLRSNGYRTYLLSNTNIIHWADTITRYNNLIADCFDDVFLSFEMHCAKPDERIFKEVDIAIGAAPRRTIFVDDTTANREAAERYVGWETCWDMKSLLREIELKELAQEIVTQWRMP